MRKRHYGTYWTTARFLGYAVGEEIHNTPLYSFHKSFFESRIWWCNHRDRHAAFVGIVFKEANETFVIDNNEEYWRRFEAEMLSPGTDTVQGR